MPNGTEAPIAFYSRTLTPAERNYSQLDKEALALVAGIKKFHEYLFGRKFTLVTDHKPLLGLIAGDKPTPQALSPRFTRWTVFLAAYDYTLIHRPGRAIPHADALSRCPLPETGTSTPRDCPVLLIDLPDNPTLITAPLVARETKKDKTLRVVVNWVLKGWPTEAKGEEFTAFKRKQGELSEQGGCLLWGDRVVIPETLRERILTTLHEGHPGVGRMKALARSYTWWPTLDADIQQRVGECQACQESRPAPPRDTEGKWDKPTNPWSRLHIDFAGPFKGNTFLVVVDAFSKWIEVITMQTTTTTATVAALEKLFTTHGLPDVVVSDNGPQLTSAQFEQFLADKGIRHALTAPFHPAANGQAERAVRTAKEVLGRLNRGDWQAKINRFLTWQHLTPHSATGRSPAELLLGRRPRSILDRIHPAYTQDTHPEETLTKGRTFILGERVYARNYGEGDKWTPGVVDQVTGPKSYAVLTEDGKRWRRHVDQLRSRMGREAHEKLRESETNLSQLNPTANASPMETEDLAEEDGSPRSLRRSPPATGAAAAPAGPQGPPPIADEAAPTGAASQATAPQENKPETEPRRSSRNPRRPAHLKDYVT